MIFIADTMDIVGARILKHSVVLKNLSNFGKYKTSTVSSNRLGSKNLITDDFASSSEKAFTKLQERPDVILRVEQDKNIAKFCKLLSIVLFRYHVQNSSFVCTSSHEITP